MFSTALFVILSAIADAAYAQHISGGGCADVHTQENFTAASYHGKWYEAYRSTFVWEELGRCITAEYTLTVDGIVHVKNTMKVGGRDVSIKGVAKDNKNEPGVGKFEVSFFSRVLPSSPYWVLGTDYDSYAVVYSCSSVIGLLKSEVIWILTRERQPTNETIETAQKIITDNGLDFSILKQTNQENCEEDDNEDKPTDHQYGKTDDESQDGNE